MILVNIYKVPVTKEKEKNFKKLLTDFLPELFNIEEVSIWLLLQAKKKK